MILPLGKYSIDVTVTDSNGTSVSSLVASCDIGIASTNDCIDLRNDIIDPFLDENDVLISKHSRYVYVFQSVYAALLYIQQGELEEQSEDDCGYGSFVQVLEILSEHFGSNSTDLCQSDYVLVCLHFLVLFIAVKQGSCLNSV